VEPQEIQEDILLQEKHFLLMWQQDIGKKLKLAEMHLHQEQLMQQ
jgi:hypothetical protein